MKYDRIDHEKLNDLTCCTASRYGSDEHFRRTSVVLVTYGPNYLSETRSGSARMSR